MDRIFVNSTNDYRTFCNATKKIEKFVAFVKLFIGILFFLCVVVVCSPLVKKQLMFDIAFPMDYKSHAIAFWMRYACVVAAYVLSVIIFMFVFLTWYIMLIFVVKYDLLESQFRDLGVTREKNASEKLAKNVTNAHGTKISPNRLTNSKEQETSYDKNLTETIRRQKTMNGCKGKMIRL